MQQYLSELRGWQAAAVLGGCVLLLVGMLAGAVAETPRRRRAGLLAVLAGGAWLYGYLMWQAFGDDAAATQRSLRAKDSAASPHAIATQSSAQPR